MRPSDIQWFASGGGISRRGPFSSQMEAYLALRLTEKAQREQRDAHGTESPYPHDIVVWPEPVEREA